MRKRFVEQVGSLPSIGTWPEKLGDRHRCPRAVEVRYMFRYFGGLGQRSLSPSFSFLLVALLMAGGVHAETGYDAWLRYAPVENPGRYWQAMPAVIASAGDSKLVESARLEAIRGVRGMLGRTLRVETGLPRENAIVLGTLADLEQLHLTASLKPDGYLLKTVRVGPVVYTVITAANDRGVLYGTFALLRKIATGESIGELDEKQSPHAAVRWVNHWDNLDGSIERGYGGRSIFWENQHVRADLSRVNDYGRMLASLGINGCSINNVNSDRRVMTPDFIPQVARIAEAFRPWGVHVVLSVDFGSPKTLGGLDSFDPIDPRIAEWWKSK